MEASTEFLENDRRCRPGRRIDVGVRRRHHWSGRDVPVPDLFRTDARSAILMIDVSADAGLRTGCSSHLELPRRCSKMSASEAGKAL
jgi:hypothetical protein